MKKITLMTITLVVLIIACGALYVSLQTDRNTPLYTDITAQEAYTHIQENPETIILDIRTPLEFERGHIEKAININYFSFSFKQQLEKLNKNQTIIVHCQTGMRSNRALNTLKELGFENILHMDKGIREWHEAKLPHVKSQ